MLPRCLLLAALLHVWLALMIGNKLNPLLTAASGWGSLSVELRGPSRPGAGAPGAVWRDDGPPGDASSPRHGGRLREQAVPLDAGPGAIEQGRWKAQELPPDPSRPEQEESGSLGDGAVERPAPALPEPPQALLSMPSEALQPLRAERIEPSPAKPSDAPVSPAPSSTQLPNIGRLEEAVPVRRLTAPGEALNLPPALTAAPLSEVPRADALPRPPDPVLQATVPRPTVTRDSLSALSSSEGLAPLRELPALDRLPEPAPTLRTLSSSAGPRAPSQREALALPRGNTTPTASDALSPLPAAESLPSVGRLASTPGQDPRALERVPKLEAQPLSGLNAQPLASQLPVEAPPGNVASTEPPGPLTRGDPLADPQPGPRASAGSPDAGARVGHDVATAPSAAASAPLRPLNLNLPRGMAGPTRRGPGLIEVLPGLPERPKTAMEKAVEEAGRDDCRKAHGDKGLLALAPLALETLRGKGCKW